MTQDEFLEKANNNFPNIEVLSVYNGHRKPIDLRCKICGTTKTVLARTLLEKRKNASSGCLKCSKLLNNGNRKTHDEFVNELKQIKPTITPLENYVNNNTKIMFKCAVCNSTFSTRPHIILTTKGCPNCYKKSHNWLTDDEFKERLKARHPNITPLSEYKAQGTSMRFSCDICGYEWQTSPVVLLKKDNYGGCPKCSGYHIPLTENEFNKRIIDRNPFVEYINGFVGLEYHANFKCKKCGYKWETLASSVHEGKGCPMCNISKGEKRIMNFLENINEPFEWQKTFDTCRGLRALPFDFYLPKRNICIEFDGAQHFEPVRFSRSMSDEDIENALIELQKRDKIKTNYCNDNNITLIRIPYTDFDNIENIINKYIS